MHDSLANLCDKVEKCRRLAASAKDELTTKVLRRMADEAEEDIRMLLTEGRDSSLSSSAW